MWGSIWLKWMHLTFWVKCKITMITRKSLVVQFGSVELSWVCGDVNAAWVRVTGRPAHDSLSRRTWSPVCRDVKTQTDHLYQSAAAAAAAAVLPIGSVAPAISRRYDVSIITVSRRRILRTEQASTVPAACVRARPSVETESAASRPESVIREQIRQHRIHDAVDTFRLR